MSLPAYEQEPQRLTSRFFFATIVAMTTFLLSAQALIALGQNYMLGSAPEKIHPATYFAAVFLLIQFFSRGQHRVVAVVRAYPGTLYVVLSVLTLTLYVALFLSVPAANLPDTWLMPVMTFILCAQLNRLECSVLRVIIDVFLAVNSLVAIGEIVLDKRVIPLSIASSLLGQYVYPIEWRASAFTGHPLTGAYTTGCYILLLIFEGRVRNLGLRLGLLLLHICSLLAFGSRAAMVLLAGLLIVSFIVAIIGSALQRKVRKDILIYGALIIPTIVFLIPAVVATGIANRFVERFTVDGGSAHARSGMLDMFQSFSWSDILLGPPRVFIEELGVRFHVGAGIESFWLGFLFSFGVVGCVIFMPSLFVFCRDIVRKTGPHATVVLVYFFACCSTSVSLSSRSLELGYVVSMLLTSRHLARPAAAPLRSATSKSVRPRREGFALASSRSVYATLPVQAMATGTQTPD